MMRRVDQTDGPEFPNSDENGEQGQRGSGKADAEGRGKFQGLRRGGGKIDHFRRRAGYLLCAQLKIGLLGWSTPHRRRAPKGWVSAKNRAKAPA